MKKDDKYSKSGRRPSKSFRSRDNDKSRPDRGDGAKKWDKKPRSDKPYGDKPRGDKPYAKKPYGERSDRPREDRPRDDRPRGERPHWKEKKEWGEKKPYKKPYNPKWDKDARDDKPRGGKPRFEKKRDDRSRDDRPRSDRPRSDRPWADKSRSERPRDDRPRGDRPRSDRPRFDRDRDDRPRRDNRDRPERPRFERSERPERAPRENSGQNPGQPRPSLFGFHAVREAWLNPARNIEILYATENAAKAFEEAIEKAQEKGLTRPKVSVVDKSTIDRLLPRDSVHQGIALVANNLEEVFVQDLIIRTGDKKKSIFVILDQVTDPHNVGAILRSACAFGADGVVLQKVHAPELSGVLAKTASGAAEHVPVAYETNLSRAIEQFKEAGYFVVGLDEEGDLPLGKIAEGQEKVVIVMGSEGSGLRRLIKENCDTLAHLPVSGAIKSLNVSNAAAVALYALTLA